MLVLCTFLFTVLLLTLLLIYCWILAFVRVWNGPYTKTEKAVWITLIVVFPLFLPILFFILRDGQRLEA